MRASLPVARGVLSWYAVNKRDLPWRTTRDPYAILVSEIMLQQTQVDRVVPKYEAWLHRFPDFKTLAVASKADVLRFWSGLGYNNRALRLQELARIVVREHGGELPLSEEALRKLPGIGPYTAGAVMVFAHNVPGRCIDVNIERIVKRIYYPKTKKNIAKEDIAETFLASFPPRRATDWGNALMDFGSAVCTATSPACASCPVRAACKSEGERPDEKHVRAKKRQSPFLHSNRWWRGRILKALAERSYTKKTLLAMLMNEPSVSDREKFHAALEGLRKERIVAGSSRLRLAER